MTSLPKERLRSLADRCETDIFASRRKLMIAAWNMMCRRAGFTKFLRLLDMKAFREAAMMLVPEGHSYASGSCGEGDIPWACVTSPFDGDAEGGCKDFVGNAATEDRALTAACLRARSSMEEEHGK